MNPEYYGTIFKRKSFHLFMGCGDEHISEAELKGIEEAFASAERLYPDIRTAIRIVPTSEAALKRDAEYCILLYSEEKLNYLLNAGYIGEQMDLYLQKNNLGSLWCGLAKPDMDTYDGMKYVILFAVRKVSDQSKYRKDMFRATRKSLGEIWTGDVPEWADTVRFAPSACNSQPWRVTQENGELTVSRYKKPGKIGILTPKAAFFFNRIDMGIFLCFLEICLAEKEIAFSRELFPDEEDREESVIAKYLLK